MDSTPFAPQDTIVAISTPPGRGGIGIVRLSGPDALTVAGALLQLRHSLDAPQAHARATFARVLDPASLRSSGPERTIDDCLVTAFHAPHSYTGDSLVEIAAHGSPVILGVLLRGALAQGAHSGLPVRLAEPGEFTQRAFLSGRLDLTQAEAVHDLIAAQTLQQARVAAQQLGGALSRRVAPAKDSLLHLIALLEAGMDFASGELDDVEVVPPAQIALYIEGARTPLAALAATFQRGQLLRNGAAIALVGRPNAGKSSLFNRLLERERAIVTPIAGTTRDTLEEALSLDGIPLRLIDTAGLHTAASDAAEQQGIARTYEALADADLVLHVLDATQPVTEDDQALLHSLSGRPHLVICNKVDLAEGEAIPDPLLSVTSLATSALTGLGLDDLRTAILAQFNAVGSLAEEGLLNNLRQQQAVTETLSALATAEAANEAGLPHELILVDLHHALQALDTLTGATTTDDILGRIFSTFCIGK
ncbi:tRNA uridine-5-carboxymethylaminomethyl(34) synthesis GTPase MnmE [Granulicella paludicola]|uniref:tRNA uridine-5-carboxymethylaminomethyl(34) synthesis GTPase MnmE n=1 Tax=Granulicella paludicola TaxID=474951 RepID=UPI0021E07697|nr:tRNA uridine-5-carboxymethylaminomethyl(34) synthesis GTPase MnmE [Granulicella paludicola]